MAVLVEALAPYQQQLLAVLTSVIVAFILWLFQARAKPSWGVAHGFSYLIDTPNDDNPSQQTRIDTTTYLVQNAGRSAATNVQVTLNYPPDGLHLSPARQFKVETNPTGNHILSIGTLAPYQQLTLNCITIGGPTPDFLNLQSDQKVGIELPYRFDRIYSKSFQGFIAILMLLGFFTGAYLLIELIGFLADVSREK